MCVTSSSRNDNINFKELGNFFLVVGPGLYEIYCKVNGKRYIGESVNVLERLGKHSHVLKNNTSDCASLQNDWNTYGSEKFETSVLFCGPEWSERATRLHKENDIISSYTPEQVYNRHPETLQPEKENTRVICEINGVRYKTIKEASTQTGQSEARIRAKLANNHEGYVVIERLPYGYSAIIANGVAYGSIVEAVREGVAANRHQVMRKLNNKSLKDWNYLDPEKKVNKDSET
jgi:hypothetical protein